MILIHSKEDFEGTTEAVIDWLDYYGAAWQRVNGEDALSTARLCVGLPRQDTWLDGSALNPDRVRVIWYRRGGKYRLGLPESAVAARTRLATYLLAEARSLRGGFPSFFPHAIHLDHPAALEVNKLVVLRMAHQLGLTIPDTLITNCRADVEAFWQRHPEGIIAKSLAESGDFSLSDTHYTIHTERIAPAALPVSFYPTLFQNQLDKEYELRIFCLADTLYTMAIFSQLDEKTQVDFRNYNTVRPNRTVPYVLPAAIGTKLKTLLRALQLTNGSIDMVRTRAGEYVFLEINPTGQFAMISEPCNYQLEQRMAEFLMRHDHESAPHPQ